MSITLPPLPEPDTWDKRYSPALLRARDLEIARVVEGCAMIEKHDELDAVLRAAARRSAKIIRPEPDCRTCEHYPICSKFGTERDACTNGDKYRALPPVRLWKSNDRIQPRR